MKILILISTILACVTAFASKQAKRKIANDSFVEDVVKIRKAAKELLGTNVKFDLKFNETDEAFVIFKTDRFEIVIGEGAYHQYGPAEGSLALVCHELGHVGAATDAYVSSEEDADYWATRVCMPTMLKLFPNKVSETTLPIDDEFQNACTKFLSVDEQKICLRSLRGAYFFREPTHKDLCNTQKLYFKSTEKELSKTPYKGQRPPNMSQCSFNNMVSGALNLKKPGCHNLMMMGFSFFGPKCGPGPFTNMPDELGIEPDLPSE
ncbi:MAG: hypothetical protein V4654_14285 [Bdellovibrionota bacterium]